MRILAALMVAAGLSGCALLFDPDARPLLTVDEVLAMHRAGVAAEVIDAKISVSRVSPPTVLQVVRLKEHGLGPRLIERFVAASTDPAGHPTHAVE